MTISTPQPIQVEVQRGKQGSFIRTEQLLCPACDHYTRHQWVQPAMNPGQVAYLDTHCTNPDCAAYYRTLELHVFMQRFGDAGRHQLNLIQYLYPWLNRDEAFDLYQQPDQRVFIDLAVRCLSHIQPIGDGVR